MEVPGHSIRSRQVLGKLCSCARRWGWKLYGRALVLVYHSCRVSIVVGIYQATGNDYWPFSSQGSVFFWYNTVQVFNDISDGQCPSFRCGL